MNYRRNLTTLRKQWTPTPGSHDDTDSQRLATRQRSALVAANAVTDFIGVDPMRCTRTPVIVRLR